MTQPFIYLVIFASCYILMKIKVDIRIKRKIAENEWVYLQNNNILAANCPRVANIILNLSLCITVLPSGKI